MLLLKLLCVPGLESIVQEELRNYPDAILVEQGSGALYLSYTDNYSVFFSLRSVTDLYLIKRASTLTPLFLSRHKSELGALIEIAKTATTYKTFSISCAGSTSPEVKSIEEFVSEKYKLLSKEEADLKIYIGKHDALWEVGVSLTARPLSLRSYKTEHLKGALNPTIAYAMNTFCSLTTRTSYLNVFSGSATLLIEAGMSNEHLHLVGIDHNPKTNSLAVRNITEAHLLGKIKLHTLDITTLPSLGVFDCITADLPFGMSVSKGEDLAALYEAFVQYCEQSLAQNGVLVAYTSEYELLRSKLLASKFTIEHTLTLTLSTAIDRYLYPRIFVCTLKN